MKKENIQAMESLSWVCHLTGLFSVFIGIVVCFIDFLNNDLKHVFVGFFLFFSGYGLVKISQRLSHILFAEQDIPK